MRPIFALPLLAAFLAAPSARASESYDACVGFVDTLPTVITTQGVWCLHHDLATAISAGNAIDIQVNNVTLDCNGFKVGNLAAGLTSQAIGVYSNNHANIKVRGCSVRGFRYGIAMQTGYGHVIEDNRVEASTNYGIYSATEMAVIRRNFVQDIGGGVGTGSVGITAAQANVYDNTVVGVVGDVDGVGIFMMGSPGSFVTGNRVSGTGGTNAYAIQTQDFHVQVQGNFLIGLNTGTGIVCGSAKGLAVDNLISDFEVPTSNCTNDGNTINP